MPQDVRVSPDGKTFYVAEMMTDGVIVVDGDSFTQTGFVPTGIGTHGLYPSRDGTKLYVINRGSHTIPGAAHGPGTVSVARFRDQPGRGHVVRTGRRQPGHGQPHTGRQGVVAGWPVRQRGLRVRHRQPVSSRLESPSGKVRTA